MLAWALKRNPDSARDAPGPDDTTQLDAPDTPAPVFAVRALKTALFGTPAPRDQSEQTRTMATEKTSAAGDKSPIKPPGILLTPGTGTKGRKRVSFGHGVKEGAAVQTAAVATTTTTAATTTSGLPNECPGKFPSPWVGDSSEKRPKTKLIEAMENSRTNKTSQPHEDAKDAKAVVKRGDDAWSDDEDVDEEEPYSDHDVTVDLNEPHSRSGKYWKSYFEEYHADAKTEMEKLVKYKQLAKSYAKKKDAEALELNKKLAEEQERVKKMESMVSELSRQVALSKKHGGSESTTDLMVEELARQTALAQDFKKQVEELESLIHGKGEGTDLVGGNGSRQRRIASPRTQKTLIETQQELRKARSQARELERVREERDRLKSELKFAEQRATKLVEESKKINTELTQSVSKVQELEKSLLDARSEALLKDRELKKLKADYEKLKEDSKARITEAQQVLKKKNELIAGLQDEVKSLKASGNAETTESGRATGDKTQTGTSKPRLRSSAETFKRNSYPQEDDTLASSRAFREKIETELGKRTPAVLSDRANLQDSRSSASSGVSQVSAYTKPTSPLGTTRAERASWSAPSPKPLATRRFQDDAATRRAEDGFQREREPVTKPTERYPRRTYSRPRSPDIEPPKADLVEDNFARLGASTTTAPHNSTMWTTAGETSRISTMPPDRRAAAKARLALKKAQKERERQQQLQQQQQQQTVDRNKENLPSPSTSPSPSPSPIISSPSNHFLYLLSDSALPLGSFAFSSGLESYLAHAKSLSTPSSFASFLPLSLSSYASTSLPFVLAAYRDPTRLPELDDTLDATIICTVGRRASVAQGRALLSIWDRAFASTITSSSPSSPSSSPLKAFSAQLKKQTTTYSSSPTSHNTQPQDDDPPQISAHLAPLFGAIGNIAGLTAEQTAYTFMLGHIKALVSAAVRAGMFGPYQAQKTLAGPGVQELTAAMIQREWNTPVEEAGQTVPVMDLWFGRHEVLYSRIFNS
ncbi:putative urease accessory protein UreF-like [Naviculisporaceae sp. PSN 640]